MVSGRKSGINNCTIVPSITKSHFSSNSLAKYLLLQLNPSIAYDHVCTDLHVWSKIMQWNISNLAKQHQQIIIAEIIWYLCFPCNTLGHYYIMVRFPINAPGYYENTRSIIFCMKVNMAKSWCMSAIHSTIIYLCMIFSIITEKEKRELTSVRNARGSFSFSLQTEDKNHKYDVMKDQWLQWPLDEKYLKQI